MIKVPKNKAECHRCGKPLSGNYKVPDYKTSHKHQLVRVCVECYLERKYGQAWGATAKAGAEAA